MVRSHASSIPPTLVNGRLSAPGVGMWTPEECQRFRAAMEAFPTGPWGEIAEMVGTRTVRQTMTHAQKVKQRIDRHARGLKPSGRKRRTKSEGSEGSETSTSSSTPPSPQSNVPDSSQRSHVLNGDVPSSMDDADVDGSVDTLTFDWVSAYLESPEWLEFMGWTDSP